MKRDSIDFHLIPPRQEAMHMRLENWARYCHGSHSPAVCAMFRLYRSDEVWQAPEPRAECDQQDGAKLNAAVIQLPEPHRLSLHWAYIIKDSPTKARKRLAVTFEGLQRLVLDARSMLVNRGT